MTTTITRVPDGTDVWGRNKVAMYDFALSGAYAALTINASDLGLKFIRDIHVGGGDVSQLTYYPFFDYGTAVPAGLQTSVKLRLGTASGTEASGTLTPSVNLRVVAVGG